MKTQIGSKNLLVTTLLLLTLIYSMRAENNESVQVSVMPGKKVLIHAYNPQKQPLSIEITESVTNSKVYTSEKPRDAVYHQVYNLSKLPLGKYMISIRQDNKVFEKEVQITEDICILQGEKIFNAPEFEIKDKKLLITFLDSKNEKVNVSFINGSEVFFKDESVNWPVSKRKYNLTALEQGDYQVVLSSEDKSYSYSFAVK